jgi:hypothetical protein
MALRAGFAAASLLGAVTTFGTSLWICTVVVLVLIVAGLLASEFVELRDPVEGDRAGL